VRAGIAPGAVELGKEALPRVRLTGGLKESEYDDLRATLDQLVADKAVLGKKHAAQSGLGLQGLADRLPEGRRRLR
jgi:hypothetical protein